MKKFEEEIILSKTNKITLDEMNPFVRRASKHVIEAGLNTGVRVNIHYQLHYILSGVGTLIIEDQVFSVSEGDFIMWCPGDVHTIESDRKEPLEVIGVQFDFTRNFSMLHYPCIHYSKESFSWDKVNEIIVLDKIKNITLCTKLFEQKLVKRYLEDLVSLFESRSAYSEFSMGGLLKVIILLVLEGNQYKVEKFKIKKEVINEVSTYIKKHYSDKLTNDFLGVQCGYHPKSS
jgi:mannose-6-phosphate isomerase-like protein (cupin superfamily)